MAALVHLRYLSCTSHLGRRARCECLVQIQSHWQLTPYNHSKGSRLRHLLYQDACNMGGKAAQYSSLPEKVTWAVLSPVISSTVSKGA